MTTDIQNRVLVKIFIGFVLTPDIRLHLNESQAWKQDAIQSTPEERPLMENHYKDADYIGKFLTSQKNSLPELRRIEIELRRALACYCPGIDVENLPTCVFPQVFIT